MELLHPICIQSLFAVSCRQMLFALLSDKRTYPNYEKKQNWITDWAKQNVQICDDAHLLRSVKSTSYVCRRSSARVGFRWDFNGMIYLLNTAHGISHLTPWRVLPSFWWLPADFGVLNVIVHIGPPLEKKKTWNNIKTSHFHRAIQLSISLSLLSISFCIGWGLLL